jgi:hypothetical protein
VSGVSKLFDLRILNLSPLFCLAEFRSPEAPKPEPKEPFPAEPEVKMAIAEEQKRIGEPFIKASA